MNPSTIGRRESARAHLQAFAQLYLRIALAVGFLSPVADRFGLWGPSGSPHVGWGDWSHFSAYAHQLMFFLPTGFAEILAIIATVAEVLFGVLLMVGLATRWVRSAAAFCC